MSVDEPTGERDPRKFTRRQILALGAAGAGLVAFSGKASGQSVRRNPTTPPRAGNPDTPPPRGRVVADLKYKDSAIRVERARGRSELYVDNEYIRVVNNNGEYRAAGFMFSPEPTPEALGKNIIDARSALAARGMQARGKKMIP